jgi:hypothetical protein
MTPVVASAPAISFHNVLGQMQIGTLGGAFETPLPHGWKMPVMLLENVQRFAGSLQWGCAEYELAVDNWLAHKMVGTSEAAVTALDGHWLGLLQDVLHAVIYRDQKGPSSRARLRPDGTVVLKDAVILIVEAKADVRDLNANDLIRKLFPAAVRVFPNQSLSTVGVLMSPTHAYLYEIRFTAGSFVAVELAAYTVSNIADRLRFITDIIKLCRWFITVQGPTSHFHLMPNVRTRTPNGHYVTWTANGLLKEYSLPIRDGMLDNIAAVYELHLANVEWGNLVNNSIVNISRVGVELRHALQTNQITREQAIGGVRAALDQLHAADWAHCDVHSGNVFVTSEGVVFLDDLEYLAKTNGTIIEHDLRLAHGTVPTSPQNLDELQFEVFCADLLLMCHE